MSRSRMTRGEQISQHRSTKGNGWTQSVLATQSGLSPSTIERAEGGGPIELRSVNMIAAALGVDPADIAFLDDNVGHEPPVSIVEKERRGPTGTDESREYLESQLDYLAKTGIRIVKSAMTHAIRAVRMPHTAGKVSTDAGKKTSSSAQDDPTLAVDAAGLNAIREGLQEASLDADCPLSEGFCFYNEETSRQEFSGLATTFDFRKSKWIVFADPVDYSEGARLGIDGSVLLTFYHVDIGYCVSVAGDLFRNKIYWRSRFRHAMKLELGSDEVLPAASLRTTGNKALSGARVNMFTGRPERLVRTVSESGSLLTDGRIKTTFSVGGSLGSLRVADGLYDASCEFTFGFRPWDFAPGNFILAGVPDAVVVDMGGDPIEFGPNDELMKHVLKDFTGDSLEACRQTFIAAATRDLADEILNHLNP